MTTIVEYLPYTVCLFFLVLNVHIISLYITIQAEARSKWLPLALMLEMNH